MGKALGKTVRDEEGGEEEWVRGVGKEILKLGLIDVSRAHFNGAPEGEVFVELAPERRRPGICGKLRTNLYGTRGAAVAWEKDYTQRLEEWGFVRGFASPFCVCPQIPTDGDGGPRRRLRDVSFRQRLRLAVV